MGDWMLKLVFAITGAALIAGAIVSVPALSANVGPAAAARKGDRLDATARIAHDRARAWPYDEGVLQHVGQPVRLVTTDNL
jgi:hypothetical protein